MIDFIGVENAKQAATINIPVRDANFTYFQLFDKDIRVNQRYKLPTDRTMEGKCISRIVIHQAGIDLPSSIIVNGVTYVVPASHDLQIFRLTLIDTKDNILLQDMPASSFQQTPAVLPYRVYRLPDVDMDKSYWQFSVDIPAFTFCIPFTFFYR